MRAAGFGKIAIVSRNPWYRTVARAELARLQGEDGARASAIVGQDFVDQNIAICSRMIPVLDAGEHCPTHLRACKPMVPIPK